MVFALVTTTQRLQPYFQSHEIIVRSNYVIYKIFGETEFSRANGRMVSRIIQVPYSVQS